MHRSTGTASMHDVWRDSQVSALRPQDVMLVTDFDGTLSEIASDPGQASILPASMAALKRLAALLRRVAVLSSRTTEDLMSLVPVRGVDLIGDSGMTELASGERARLDRFNVEAVTLLSTIPGVWLELKPVATAVHYRHANVGPEQLLQRLRPVLAETGLTAQPGRRVIEVMPREQPKGDALRAVIDRLQPHGVICLGDDENDRPMFQLVAALERPHLSVGVASAEAPADLFAACDLVVGGPHEVSRFLTMVAEWATSAVGSWSS